MRKLFYLVCFSILLSTCDDGDVINVTLDFEETFRQCGNNSLVFYKINESSSETLSIQIPELVLEDVLVLDENTGVYEETFLLGGSNVFNYRSYGTTPLDSFFCNDVPPSNLQIDSDEVSLGGSVTIRTVLLEDDNDGIPAEDEDENLDGDNDPSTNPTDTDMDGIPNYLDQDDDGDNVLTINEIDTDNLDGDDNPLTNPLNTDADSTLNPDTIPDYLDTDDDGDGVLTRNEESVEQDQNPANDVTDPNVGADYLNEAITASVPAVAYRVHNIFQMYTVSVIANNISLPSITQQILDFGTLDNSGESPDITNSDRQVTPEFN